MNIFHRYDVTKELKWLTNKLKGLYRADITLIAVPFLQRIPDGHSF